ncbi:MAG: HEAT repeat domain-containing protein [Alphaproteobacteria bacterium]|nr:HEAT repeat domain-containing protein [Alphaproteobacteria bacterium]
MSVLTAIWLTSLLLSASATAAMCSLIAARVVRTAKAEARAALKRRLTQALLAAAEDDTKTPPFANLSRHRRTVLTEAGIELLDLVRGAMAFRIVDVLMRAGANRVLDRWIKSANPLRRAAAAEAMAHFANHAGLAELQAALDDTDADVRLAAASSLIKLGAAPPLPDLLRHLNDHGTPSARIAQILGLIVDQHPGEILKLAQDGNAGPFIRAKAIETMAGTGDYALLPHVIGLATDDDADVRAAAIRSLAKLAHPAARDTIANAIADKAWFVRAAAAEAAGKLGLYDLVPVLTTLVDDPIWWVRFRASEALIALDEVGRAALRNIAAKARGRSAHAASVALAERAQA